MLHPSTRSGSFRSLERLTRSVAMISLVLNAGCGSGSASSETTSATSGQERSATRVRVGCSEVALDEGETAEQAANHFVLRQLAERFDVTVSDEDVDAALRLAAATAGGSAPTRDAVRQQVLLSRLARKLGVSRDAGAMRAWLEQVRRDWMEVETSTTSEGHCEEQWPTIDPESLAFEGNEHLDAEGLRQALGEQSFRLVGVPVLPPEPRERLRHEYHDAGHAMVDFGPIRAADSSPVLPIREGPVYRFGELGAVTITDEGERVPLAELSEAMTSALDDTDAVFTPSSFTGWLDGFASEIRQRVEQGLVPEPDFTFRSDEGRVDIVLVFDTGSASCVNLQVLFDRSRVGRRRHAALEEQLQAARSELQDSSDPSQREALQQRLREAEQAVVEELVPVFRRAATRVARERGLRAPRLVTEPAVTLGSQPRCRDLTYQTLEALESESEAGG